MKLSVLCKFTAATAFVLLASETATAVPAPLNGIEVLQSAPQAQQFYSERVSRIADANGQRCMVSTGTDWKNTGLARSAQNMERVLAQFPSRAEAFARTDEVSLEGLASNTPFISAIHNDEGIELLRFAAGFAIKPDTIELRLGADRDPIAASFVIEERGDTAVVADPKTAELIFAAFAAGDDVTFSARSQKNGSTEHYVQYTYTGGFADDALTQCRGDLLTKELALKPAPHPTFNIEAVTGESPERVAELRGMACNRELDLDDAELVRLTGNVAGFSTPLSQALVTRDEDGGIINIVSGDLWRISKTEDGYDMAISRSITSQAPLMKQAEKACTRFDSARCVNLTTDPETGSVVIAECLGVFMAESIVDPAPALLSPGGFPFLLVAPVPIGGTGGNSPSPSSPQPVTPQTPGSGPSPIPAPYIPFIPNGPTGIPTEPAVPSDPTQLNNVPIPGGMLLILSSVGGLLLLGRMRRGTESA